jgi:hypothetical protein
MAAVVRPGLFASFISATVLAGAISAAPDAAPARCLNVAPKIVSAIGEGLTVRGRGKLRAVRAVRWTSVGFTSVSADIQAPRMMGRTEIATWSTNKISDYGVVMSVDALAKEFSDWADGGRSHAHLSMRDDGAAASVACTRHALG